MSDNTKKGLIVAAIVITIIIVIYMTGKKAGKGAKPDKVKLPKGVSIPTGWTPRPLSVAIYNAIDGAGTDEEAIWNTLEPLNSAQKATLYNDFNVYLKEKGHEGETLFDWFEEDLEGDDLRRALGHFKGIV